MSGLEGYCPKCHQHYHGWVLSNPWQQKCDRCGSDLELFRDGVPVKKQDNKSWIDLREDNILTN